MPNVIIVGNGPAGISAALYTKRGGIETTIVGRDLGALKKADKIENYYGFEEPVSGEALVKSGIASAERIGCEMVTDEVIGISFEKKLTVKTKNKDYSADAVILATGAVRNVPKITGITELEGRGVSYCAVCDAFFYRGKDVCVLGSGEYALHEALELLPIVNSVTLLSNGDRVNITDFPENIKLNEKKITAIKGTDTVSGVEFEDGEILDVLGVFVAVGVASSSDLARKLGAQVDGINIAVNQQMETNIPGLYAAGDCTGGMLQIYKAVYDGGTAGTEVIKYLRKNK